MSRTASILSEFYLGIYFAKSFKGNFMSRNFQVVRVMKLLFLLCQNRRTGLSIAHLCEVLSANKRTLYRDVQALKSVGVVIEHQMSDDGFIRLILKNIPILME